ncbi:MAG TPA: RidA family protein [Anaerolineales bacterium]|jgi:enamine deaminase RidA (YjgF/YER057c/UK114 family)
MTGSLRFINPPGMSKPTGYSHVVEASGGRTIYISGQVALDQDRNLIGKNDLRAQAQQVFANLKTALEAAGTDFDHVVKLTYFVLDASQMPIVREVRDQYLNKQSPPASTAVEVRRLVMEDWLIEVDAIAVIPA